MGKKKELKTRDVMSKGVKRIEQSAMLVEAARRMVEENVSSLVVIPIAKDEPFGIITSKDIVNALADGCDVKVTKVGEVAATPLVVITPGVPISYAAKMMKRTNMRHLAVFNGREIVGIISNVDILRAIAGK